MTGDRNRRTGAVASVLLVVVVVGLLLAWMVLFQVEFTEDVLVQTFGKTTSVLRGKADAGLHARWPFAQQLVRYDARTFVFDDTMNELSTSDQQNITLTTFCAWRIDDPVKFQSSIRTIDAAQKGIQTKLRSAKSGVLGKRMMSDLVNTDPRRMRIPEIESEILAAVAAEAQRDYGVQVSLVGIKTLGLPQDVAQEVIKAMQDERKKEADILEAAGQAQAQAIRERAREARDKILAFADRKAGEIRSEGARAAAEWYQVFEKNWQLAAFLRSLEGLKKELQGRSVFLLDGSEIPAVKFFSEGPKLPTQAPMPPGPTSKPAGGK
jgi:membrane protease subunit HflC